MGKEIHAEQTWKKTARERGGGARVRFVILPFLLTESLEQAKEIPHMQ